MNVFADWHHNDLKYSLQLLFEKRLQWNLYFPIGLEWYTEGFWNIYPSMDTAKQYLDIRDIYTPPDGTLPLNDITQTRQYKDYYSVLDKHNKTQHKAITLDQFKEMPIDIVIASIPKHIEPFKKLASMKGAKFIFQAGNVFPEVQYNLLPNLMANTLPQNPPSHTVQYHQEFDLNIFKPLFVNTRREITSFVNIYEKNGGFEDYITLKGMMPDFTFKSYGSQNQDGVVNTTSEMAIKMNESYFGFHSKRMGDGYGHILYNWFACGKPIITRISDYKGKMGEELLIDGETCFDIDNIQYNGVKYSIEELSPDKYEYMCQQVKNRFSAKVDFNSEELRIREFVNNLK